MQSIITAWLAEHDQAKDIEIERLKSEAHYYHEAWIAMGGGFD